MVGFNSQRYDLNCIKPYLIKCLKARGDVQFVVKRSNALMFLNISNYLAPGYQYSKYVKAYDCTEEKGDFPYEWMDDLSKLDDSKLPDHKDLYSSHKVTGGL